MWHSIFWYLKHSHYSHGFAVWTAHTHTMTCAKRCALLYMQTASKKSSWIGLCLCFDQKTDPYHPLLHTSWLPLLKSMSRRVDYTILMIMSSVSSRFCLQTSLSTVWTAAETWMTSTLFRMAPSMDHSLLSLALRWSSDANKLIKDILLLPSLCTWWVQLLGMAWTLTICHGPTS